MSALGRVIAAALLGIALPVPAAAHRLAPSLLELREGAAGVVDVRWKTPRLRPAGVDLTPRLPAHCESAAPVRAEHDPVSITLRWRADCGAKALGNGEVGIDGLDASGTNSLLRIQFADGRSVRTVFAPGNASFEIPRRESQAGVAVGFARLGFEHVLGGADHLLFVLGLALLLRGRRLAVAVTAFTVGHSVTLALAVLGAFRLPPVPVEIAIAASLFWLAVQLVAGDAAPRRVWAIVAGFGLLHGLGFAGALAEVGLPDGEIPLALVSFNAGIEVGQLAAVAVVLALRHALARPGAVLPPTLARASAYAIGSLAAYWVIVRVAGV